MTVNTPNPNNNHEGGMTENPLSITVSPFTIEDVPELSLWGEHEDPRFSHYDFSKFFSDSLYYSWYRLKTEPGKKLYAIKEGDRVRGYISLREHNLIRNSYVMGIVIDPVNISRGIGQRALTQFLKIYFEELGCKLLKLKVSDFNKRALRVYEKTGFEFKSSKYEPFENQLCPFKLLVDYEDFLMRGNKIYTKVSSYSFSRARYNELYKKG